MVRNFPSLVAGILLALSVIGCSTNIENLPANYSLVPEKGVVVMSLTSSGECGYAIYVDIRRIDEKFEQTIGLQDILDDSDWQRSDPDCSSGDKKDYFGKLAVIDLPEGTYEIYKVSGIGRYGAFTSSDEFTIVFNVEGNKVSYVGNAHFHIGEDDYTFDTFDMSQRDLLIFNKDYPLLAKDVSVSILQSYTD